MPRLKHVGSDALTIERRRRGKGLAYINARGRVVRDKELRARARHLAIPPAWTGVRIAPDPLAHLQACGTDAAGRVQYLYHPDWEVRRTIRKQRNLAALTQALPRARRHVRQDLELEAGDRALALAIGVALIDRTAMRVGRERYLDSHGTRGAGTLFTRDVTVKGDEVRIQFPAKSGKEALYVLKDAALAAAITKVKSIPGKRLLMYRDAEGRPRAIRTEQINAYLREISGVPVSAKDFRTLHASALAGEALAQLEPGASESARKRQVADVIKRVASFLQNTPAICRKSYVAPQLIALFDKGRLANLWSSAGEGGNGLRQREMRLSAVLSGAAG
jgi:DNA topoisomerase-1